MFVVVIVVVGVSETLVGPDFGSEEEASIWIEVNYPHIPEDDLVFCDIRPRDCYGKYGK